MKKIILAFILLLNSTLVSFAGGPEIQGNQKAKEQLLKIHTELSQLDNEQWTQLFMNLAKFKEQEGDKVQAEIFLNYSDPSLKILLLERMNDNIDELSNNGLIFMLATPLGGLGFGLATVGFMGTMQGYSNAKTDMGMMCWFMAAILTLTLGDEQTAQDL
jgi:hypothetical protein